MPSAVGPPPPVRLGRPRCSSPFAPGRAIVFACVEGSGLAAIGIRAGDHVALARDLDVEGTDVAAVVGEDGTSALWACTREGARLRIGTGPASGHGLDRSALAPSAGSRLTARHARVQGVVVAVLRRDG